MRKRSKYRPKGVIRDPLAYVLSGMKVVGQIGAGTDLMIKNHMALDNVRQGVGTKEDIDILIGALNITDALSLMRIGDEWQSEIRAAQDALLELGRRGVETGKFILRGPELTALNLAMEVHDAQLEVCTVTEMEQAMKLIDREFRAGKMRPIIRKDSNGKEGTKAQTANA